MAKVFFKTEIDRRIFNKTLRDKAHKKYKNHLFSLCNIDAYMKGVDDCIKLLKDYTESEK
jgi:hypothetical protein